MLPTGALPPELGYHIQMQLLPGERVVWIEQPLAYLAINELDRRSIKRRKRIVAVLVIISLSMVCVPTAGIKFIAFTFFMVGVVMAVFLWGGARIEREEREKLRLSACVITNQRAMYSSLGNYKTGDQVAPIYQFVWRPSLSRYKKTCNPSAFRVGAGALMELENRLEDLKCIQESDGSGSLSWIETAGGHEAGGGDLHVGFIYIPNVREAERLLRALLPPDVN